LKILSARIHGYLDFLVVILFASAPAVLHLSGISATLSYLLAGVHLAVTLLTDFPSGVLKVIPFQIHGWIELIVAPTLAVCPWVLGFSGDQTATVFYVAFGGVVFLTWVITDYKGTGK
jgi:SPW repeat